jgi:hypothetical protein
MESSIVIGSRFEELGQYVPNECLLYQAGLWVTHGIPPVEPRILKVQGDSITMGISINSKENQNTALADLCMALFSGKIYANGILLSVIEEEGGGDIDFCKTTYNIPAAYWHWERIDWDNSGLKNIFFYENIKSEKPLHDDILNIKVNTAQLLSLFPPDNFLSDDYLPKNLKVDNSKIETRGRKPKYDWEAFLQQVALIAHGINGLPETQAELENIMSTWCMNEWKETPSESLIRDKISPIYQLLKKAKK